MEQKPRLFNMDDFGYGYCFVLFTCIGCSNTFHSISRKGRGIRAQALERLSRLSASDPKKAESLDKLTGALTYSDNSLNGPTTAIVRFMQ